MTEDSESRSNPEKLFSDFPPQSRVNWRREVDLLLQEKAYKETMLTGTYEGIELQPIYDRENLEKFGKSSDVYRYLSSRRKKTFPDLSRSGWEIAQEIKQADPGELNLALIEALKTGQNSVNFPVDALTAAGLNPSSSYRDLIGKGGVSLFRTDDLDKILTGIDMTAVPLNITAGNSAMLILAMLAAEVEKKGVAVSSLKGSVGLDPLAEAILNGEMNGGPGTAFENMYRMTRWAGRNAPGIRTITINSTIYHNGGASASQETAAALCTGIEYIRQLQERGLEIDQIVPLIRLEIAVGSHFFLELAKFRVVRLLWSKIIGEFGGSVDNGGIFIHARTGNLNKSRNHYYLNLLRTSTEALCAVLGGCDSLDVGTFDSMTGTPSKFARRLARNQQLIIREESKMNKVADPGGGSWYLESLTSELAEKTWQEIKTIESEGGILASLEKGSLQSRIEKVFRLRLKNLESGQDVLLGVNRPVEQIGNSRLSPAALDKSFFKSRLAAAAEQEKVSVKLEKNFRFDQLIEAFQAGATLEDLTACSRKQTGPSIKLRPLRQRSFTDTADTKMEKKR